jgi:hypothetical protein
MNQKRTTPVKFTTEERETIGAAAAAVWDYVGYDALQMVGEENGKGEAATMSRAEVIEVCLDAGRMEDQLRTRRNMDKRRGIDSVVTDYLLVRVAEAGYAQLIKIVTPHFPFKRYGF